MKSLLFKSSYSLVAFIIVTLLIVVSIVFSVATITHADSTTQVTKGRLLTIYDRGTQKIIVSDASTVGEALSQAGIVLAAQDTVEPAVTQKLVANEYDINIYRARPVLVVDGNIRERIITPYQTAAQITQSAGITLYPEDWTTLSRVDDLSEGAGLELTITRATSINFVLYGQPTTIRTHAKTVAELLKEKNITLGANDTLTVPVTQPIVANMSIELWRNGSQTANVNEVVPFGTQVINDADQPVGYVSVQTPGVNGARTVTYEIEMKNGVEISRTQIQSVIITQPTDQVEVHGSKLTLSAGYSAQQIAVMTQAGIASSDQGYAAYIVDHENGLWCPTRWQGQSVCTADYVALYAPNAQVGYGLCQATPGDKMASAGSDWETNPVTQMEWCNSYAASRYGSWYNAYTHWVANHNW
jgi:uncharacterized protein YabE (DUF348 family)